MVMTPPWPISSAVFFPRAILTPEARVRVSMNGIRASIARPPGLAEIPGKLCNEIAAKLIHESDKACNQNGLDGGPQEHGTKDQLKLVDTTGTYLEHPKPVLLPNSVPTVDLVGPLEPATLLL
ncbi:hypothetical protein BGX31_000305 [Mortierella sp. GBA43]|nr:hypothetical protein BGX31_000305 [Mortierella sp. GBA43]